MITYTVKMILEKCTSLNRLSMDRESLWSMSMYMAIYIYCIYIKKQNNKKITVRSKYMTFCYSNGPADLPVSTLLCTTAPSSSAKQLRKKYNYETTTLQAHFHYRHDFVKYKGRGAILQNEFLDKNTFFF